MFKRRKRREPQMVRLPNGQYVDSATVWRDDMERSIMKAMMFRPF